MPVFVFLIVKTYSLYFFANLDIAFKIDHENRKILVQPTKTYENAEITVRCGEVIGEYTERNFDKFNMPEVITDMPSAAGMNSAEELYLAGVHAAQYRDPAVEPDSYRKEALKRDINHIPSLIAMAEYEYFRYVFESAKAMPSAQLRMLQFITNGC